LIDELMLGKLHEVKRLLAAIIGETAEYSYVSFQLAFSHLSFALNNAVRMIRHNAGSSTDQEAPNFPVLTYDQIETLEELTERYCEVLDTLFRQIEERKRTKYDDLTERVIWMIDTRYMNPSLSLDVIADDLGLSATYIGRIFKQHTMKTILGYITEVRMNKVRELLSHTENSIGEIAEQTGFSNSPYFYKAFKKMNGVTPVEYRKYGKPMVPNNKDDAYLA
jgi:two-component system response regulator YesN